MEGCVKDDKQEMERGKRVLQKVKRAKRLVQTYATASAFKEVKVQRKQNDRDQKSEVIEDKVV